MGGSSFLTSPRLSTLQNRAAAQLKLEVLTLFILTTAATLVVRLALHIMVTVSISMLTLSVNLCCLHDGIPMRYQEIKCLCLHQDEGQEH